MRIPLTNKKKSTKISMNSKYVVFDFETSGLSPRGGDRAIEIGAVLVTNGVITDQFQMLMNSGMRISSFIESYTGITNAMLLKAPSSSLVMKQFSKFIGDTPLIAHNASFDKNFLDAEFSRVGCTLNQPIACSLKFARRLYQQAPNHKLMTLIEMNKIKITGQFHRALADAQMTAQLWIKMENDLRQKYNMTNVDFKLMHKMTTVSKKDFNILLQKKH